MKLCLSFFFFLHFQTFRALLEITKNLAFYFGVIDREILVFYMSTVITEIKVIKHCFCS